MEAEVLCTAFFLLLKANLTKNIVDLVLFGAFCLLVLRKL